MSEYKKYLGDAVYFDFDGYHVVLTTENGIFATNTIALEPEVMEQLFKAYESLQGKLWKDKPEQK